jgi:hypothetical protein
MIAAGFFRAPTIPTGDGPGRHADRQGEPGPQGEGKQPEPLRELVAKALVRKGLALGRRVKASLRCRKSMRNQKIKINHAKAPSLWLGRHPRSDEKCVASNQRIAAVQFL